ncbi:MAG: class I SAM-dependent methyltransferase [Candidatus Goldbacteria bacterium]|nr:class I SAM-dependent methyltransferase [Candidatus Goldiibacteriota bacterium]HPD18503.1 class I SAM-dependent methyltransferase [Candidatus Goldiibacteriota bacterium]
MNLDDCREVIKKFFETNFDEKFYCSQYSEEENKKLAKDVIRLLDVKKGSSILDWCGGWGRISIHFAREGFKVTILDIMQDRLLHAKEIFTRENLPLTTVCVDCRNTPTDVKYDFATCMFCSVGFFDDDEQIKAFKSLYDSLNKNGRFILDCLNLFFLADKKFEDTKMKRKDGKTNVQINEFDFVRNVLHSRYKIVNEKWEVEEESEFFQRLYTPRDIVSLLSAAGFKIENIYGNYNGDPISFSSPQIVVVCSK